MDNALPAPLQERFRWVVSPERQPFGDSFVLYWMHSALRAHENPALDSAICLARDLGLPLLVYHGLSEEYPFASDRHHAFLLQGHRDVQRELADRGIAAVFHLQRQGNRGTHLRDLTRASAVMVTEEMPVPPITPWLERLAIKCPTPIAAVDTTCLATVHSLNRCVERAFQFRQCVESIHAERVERPYTEQPFDVPCLRGQALREAIDFDPLCLQTADLADLIGQCKIDHSVAPVPDTPGGSRAGYARWDAFRQSGLDQYARHRNDAARHDGVSRMSAYLHYGMVSPFRIAREAARAGAEKYLDELLIWRELAFHFCFHRHLDVDSLDAIPEWARDTLEKHLQDPRENYSWETLARGTTGNRLWDLAQQSLLRHGELHNNLRMTWGKAFVGWLRSPQAALGSAIDLNHRYALDGRSPASYGGILWCFGQFDRPFTPEQPTLGTIRPRLIEEHAQRLDVDRFQDRVHRSIAANLPRVAVIGAGLGGLIAARTLHDHGIDVTVFDKSRGVGGRTSTRRAESECGSELRFDHGAQYMTARDPRFCRLVKSWIDDGIVAPWLGRIVRLASNGHVISDSSDTPRYVGTPGMNAVAKHLAEPLETHLGAAITELGREGDQWTLSDENGENHTGYDIVLCNCPPRQTAALIAGQAEFHSRLETLRMRPCWAVMVASPSLGDIDFAGAFVDDSPISWIANNASKPGRANSPGWIIHASADWSEQHLDRNADEVIATLKSEFERLIGRSIDRPDYLRAHRWRYAIPEKPLNVDHLFDATVGLGACGDWCDGNRIEAAFLSGAALAGAVMRHVTIDRPAAPATKATKQLSLFA
ncbi:MAG: FAD-dependent oxidoreductase [Planctomycetota bacterium]